VKYLEETHENKLLKTQIKNQVIGIKTLGENSTGKTYFELVEEKILDLDEEIREQFLGITHDHASNLSGSKSGLVGLLRKHTDNYFFDLCDPCHHLSLCLTNSLHLLPENIRNFIDNIHNHFISP